MSEASPFRPIFRPFFRIIAIVQDVGSLRRIVPFIERSDHPLLALMLRDPEHRPDAVRLLLEAAHDLLPADHAVTIITNGADGGSVRHLTTVETDAVAARTTSEPSTPYGCSAHSIDEIAYAMATNAGYVTYSPIYATTSKPGEEGLGLKELRRADRLSLLPIFAQGGVDAIERVREVEEAGAFGVSGITLGTDLELLRETLEYFIAIDL